MVSTMRSLRDDPRPQDALQLQDNLYRVRVGDYRILYAVFDRVLVVFVWKTTRRAEATYRDLRCMVTRAKRELGDKDSRAPVRLPIPNPP